MAREDEFNRFAAGEFVKEYEREAGRRLRFKRVGTPFPDAVLETVDGDYEIGVEFVSVVLSFIHQEQNYFDQYRRCFYAVLKQERPRFKHVAIKLQPNGGLIEGQRPIRLPAVASIDGKRLIAEFGELISNYCGELPPGGVLLGDFVSDGHPRFPELLKYFDAVLLNLVGEDYSGRLHPDDPVIESPVICYMQDELGESIRRAVAAKSAKGRAYATDILVLHTLPERGKPDFGALGMAANDLAVLGRALVAQDDNLSERFQEIWLLGDCTIDGKRLWKLK